MSRDFASNFAGSEQRHTRHSSVEEDVGVLTLPKKLIVCCDGTWQDSDNGYVKGKWGKPGHMQNPTNVTRIARAISAEDDAHHPQIVYYQAGVGTGLGLTNKLLGGGTGLGLSEHIREAYAFLVNNYRVNNPEKPGVEPDSIFITGFSRGAFTARSISGLIGAVGLLKKRAMPHFYQIFQDWENAGNHEYKPQFFDSYFKLHPEVNKTKPDLKLALDNTKIDKYMDEFYRRLLALDLTQTVTINCVGVWDTVGSLGIPVNPFIQKLLPFLPSYVRDYSWFDTRIDKHINNAFQALALDEHRYPFSPTLWEKTTDAPTNMKQVWFPGAHSNVGGSYDDTGMADITLAWMMDQLSGHTTKHPDGFKHREWIKFEEHYMQYWEKPTQTAKDAIEDAPYKGWAMGYVYESMYFPQSVLGKRVRAPGRYCRTDFRTGKPSDILLENTNEYIHASVRARMDMGGRGVEDDWSQLFPNSTNVGPSIATFIRKLRGKKPATYLPQMKEQPLYGWRLDDGHSSHAEPNREIDMSPGGLKEIVWHYEGTDKCSNRAMKEDLMGPFELQLLQKDQNIAEQVVYSNNQWQWRKREPSPNPLLRHTL